MRSVFYVFAFMLFAGTCFAGATNVMERPIQASNGGEVVSASTTSWTVGWSTAYSGTSGFYVTVSPSSTDNVYMTIAASAPTASTTTIAIVLKPGITQFHNAGEAVKPYFIASGSAAVNVYLERVKQ